jgi:putative transposase
MTRLGDRQILVRDIEQACADGARLAPACALAGIDARRLRRWQAGDGLKQGDRRPDADRPIPSHALSEGERARIIVVANEPRFAETPPARIVPALADEGIYLASESSFHRVLREHGQMNRRGRAQPPRRSRPPTTHIASRPGDVWCWDVTFLPAQIQGRWFYFYLILDLFSRKIVGFEVHDTDSAEHAAHLARRTALAEDVHARAARPVLHGDNGATLKATTVLAMLHWLGIEPSYSRPRVSDDNAFAEALFRTAKYRPEFPLKGFANLHIARQWAARFVHWYNHEHRHSGIRYVTPAQRHAGQDGPVLIARHALYQEARQRNPQRWSGPTRNWTPAGAVTLNPQRDTVVRAATSQIQLSGSIGQPAFPSRPGNAKATARNAGDGRSRATRSHAQGVLAREHGEDGEHRTFSAGSTVAHSSPLGGPPQPNKQQAEYKLNRYALRAATCLTLTASTPARGP